MLSNEIHHVSDAIFVCSLSNLFPRIRILDNFVAGKINRLFKTYIGQHCRFATSLSVLPRKTEKEGCPQLQLAANGVILTNIFGSFLTLQWNPSAVGTPQLKGHLHSRETKFGPPKMLI